EKPADALEIGQVVKAEVIKMDLDSKKIGMSISKIARDAARAARNAERNEYKPYMGKSDSLKNEGLAAQLGDFNN
ncbi:MAG: hypothetical protein MJ050_02850, partial [Phascolarctobacterium sp.]|nr:hypothetical protein [Phascolarctobacterium sp.]